MSKNEKIDSIASNLDNLLEGCTLCPHMCRVDRKKDKKGICRAGYLPVISSAMPHHGEEPPISGHRGSGTIFFSYCNMKCVYCQNYQISQQFEGSQYSIKQLAGTMARLQNSGCHNINLVSPTIWNPQIVKAFSIAKHKGLNIPLVYNTGGYDNHNIIKMLDGIIDIYMPDIRYSNDITAEKYSLVKNYVRHNRLAIKEMYRQVGDLKLDSRGVATKGMLIRLLVLPDNIGGIKKTLDFIKDELSTDIYLSIMAQYHPAYRAYEFTALSRRITPGEYFEVVKYAEKLGFGYGWTQDHFMPDPGNDPFHPDFKRKNVFKYYDDK